MYLFKILKLTHHHIKRRGWKAVVRKLITLMRIKNFPKIFDVRTNYSRLSTDTVFNKKWILAVNDTTWASNDYRGLNFYSAFQHLNIPVTYIDHYSFHSDKNLQSSSKGVILFRTDSFRKDYTEVQSEIPIVYDTDDLCFDRRYFTKENVPGILSTSIANQEWLLGGSLDGQENIVGSSRVGTGPTNRIIQSMRELGASNVMLIDNVLPDWMAEQSRFFRKIKKSNKNEFRIVYASGSNTHMRDFSLAWPGIEKFLTENSKASLTIIGYSPFNKSKIPRSIQEQIFFRSHVAHIKLMEEHTNYDLALAPVEQNEFTDGKSALKYVHAASLGIPCLASPTEPFVRALGNRFPEHIIQNNDWYEKISKIFHTTERKSLTENLIEEFELNWTMTNFNEQISKLMQMF